MNPGPLSVLDITFAVIILASMIFGVFNGLVREILSLFFFIAAAILASLYYPQVAGLIGDKFGKSPHFANYAGFIAIFVAVLIMGAVITHFIKKIFNIQPLKSIDRILGAVFGLFRGIVLSGIIVFGFMAFPVNDRLLLNSKFSPFMVEVVQGVYRRWPLEWRKHFPEVEQWQGKHDRQKNNATGGRI